MSDQILLSKSDGVAVITFNRPEKLNAMTPEMCVVLRDIRRDLNSDNNVRAVVVRSSQHRAFSAGTDIAALDDYEDNWAWRNRIDYCIQIRRIVKPVVAAISGWAVGGGFEIALNCDIRVAAQSAQFGSPEVGHGWVGGGGATQLLARLVGYGKASLITFTGTPIEAAEAYRMGIVEKLVGEDGEEFVAAMEIAKVIARHTAIATQTIKESLRATLNGGLDLGSKYENDLMCLAFAMGNSRKGIDRFVNKEA